MQQLKFKKYLNTKERTKDFIQELQLDFDRSVGKATICYNDMI